MKIDINKLETVVVVDKYGKRVCSIKPSCIHVTTINKKQYLTITEVKNEN